MDIFESLENLNVSEECFNEIMDMVEEFVYRNEPLPDDKPIATGWNNGDGTYKAVVFKSKKGKWNDPDTNKHLDGKTFKSMKGAENYAHKKGYVVSTVRDRIADVKEDLASLTREKFGTESPQYKKADELWDKAWMDARNYFEKRGANHDLSTKQDLGIEKFDDNRLKQVEKREKGRNENALKDGLKRGGIIPKQITPESSRFKPNTKTNPNDPESGVAKAIRRNNDKVK